MGILTGNGSRRSPRMLAILGGLAATAWVIPIVSMSARVHRAGKAAQGSAKATL